jgi:uncharacterized membrane protein
MKVFTDAVVAIALTLLILPLLESVSEAARAGLGTARFLGEHTDQLFNFAISFAVIAAFWTQHHVLFSGVERLTGVLLLLNFGWLFTVVWLPVPTAMAGTMHPDALQKVLYIGTMLVSTLITVAMYAVLDRRPVLRSPEAPPTRPGQVRSLVLAGLFGLALVLTLTVPALGYLPTLLLFLRRLVERAVTRRLDARDAR